MIRLVSLSVIQLTRY